VNQEVNAVQRIERQAVNHATAKTKVDQAMIEFLASCIYDFLGIQKVALGLDRRALANIGKYVAGDDLRHL